MGPDAIAVVAFRMPPRDISLRIEGVGVCVCGARGEATARKKPDLVSLFLNPKPTTPSQMIGKGESIVLRPGYGLRSTFFDFSWQLGW